MSGDLHPIGKIVFGSADYGDPRYTGANHGYCPQRPTPGYSVEYAPQDPTRPGQCQPARLVYEEPDGFFDLSPPMPEVCRNPEHNPPEHLYIPPGKGYRHRCPGCGSVSTIVLPQVTM